MPNIYIILQAIVKHICTADSDRDPLTYETFFSCNKGFEDEWGLNEQLPVTIYFTRNSNNAERFRNNIYKHFAKYDSSRNVGFVDVSEIENCSFAQLVAQYGDIPTGQVTLDFITPINFPEPPNGDRDNLVLPYFFGGLIQRLNRLFGAEFTMPDFLNVTKAQYGWRYMNVVKDSQSMQGTHKYINGYLGRYILNNVSEELGKYLLLMSELHAGTSITFGLGRYKISHKTDSAEINTVVEERLSLQTAKPLYIDDVTAKIGITSDSLTITTDEDSRQIGFVGISDIIMLNWRSFSKDFMDKCVELDIPILTVSNHKVIILSKGNSRRYESIARHMIVFYRLTPEDMVNIAKEFVLLKIGAFIDVFSRKHETPYNQACAELSAVLNKVRGAKTLSTMRGYEAEAAKISYRYENMMLKNETYRFEKRERAAPDIVNCLFNRTSTIFAYRINIHLRRYALNPYLGFLHSDKNRYESLVYDLIEPFRAYLEQFCIKMLNYGKLNQDDFIVENNKYRLTKSGYSKFLNNFEQMLVEFSLLEILDSYISRIYEWTQTGEPLSLINDEF